MHYFFTRYDHHVTRSALTGRTIIGPAELVGMAVTKGVCHRGFL